MNYHVVPAEKGYYEVWPNATGGLHMMPIVAFHILSDSENETAYVERAIRVLDDGTDFGDIRCPNGSIIDRNGDVHVDEWSYIGSSYFKKRWSKDLEYYTLDNPQQTV